MKINICFKSEDSRVHSELCIIVELRVNALLVRRHKLKEETRDSLNLSDLNFDLFVILTLITCRRYNEIRVITF